MGLSARRLVLAIAVFAGLCLAAPSAIGQRARVSASLPARLGDAEFWRLSAELSEPAGSFRSENLVSNEHTFQYVIPGAEEGRQAGGRVPGRGAGPELHLHGGHAAADGVHRRHPARQPAAAPDVQGALRALGRPRGVPVAAVLQEAAGGPGRGVHGRGPLHGVRPRADDGRRIPGSVRAERGRRSRPAGGPAQVRPLGGRSGTARSHLLRVLLGGAGSAVLDRAHGHRRRQVRRQFPDL